MYKTCEICNYFGPYIKNVYKHKFYFNDTVRFAVGLVELQSRSCIRESDRREPSKETYICNVCFNKYLDRIY